MKTENFTDATMIKLQPVDEGNELPPDPKTKIFGRAPGPLIPVKFDFYSEPEDLLADLTEFIFKHAKLMEFGDNRPDFWKVILSAVLSETSYEHKVFKANLDILIEENFAETGIDPRIEGPPDHIANQVVEKFVEGQSGPIRRSRIPNYSKKTEQ